MGIVVFFISNWRGVRTKNLLDNESALIPVKAWRRIGDNPLPAPVITWSYDVLKPLWIEGYPWEKNWPPWLLTVSSQWAHREITVCSRWPIWSQPAVTEPWPGPWLSWDLAATEPWSYWRCRDCAVTSPWLNCDLAVTELWPRLDWAVTSLSRDWAMIIGPGAVTTVVTVSSRWAHGDIFFFSWVNIQCTFNY